MTRILILLLSINVATLAFAQGNSIPKSSKASPHDTELLDEELPEGVQYRYALFNGLSVSVNIFDPVLDLVKTDHANYEATVTANIYNRFFPQVAVGLGYSQEVSNDKVKYSVNPSRFFKIGMLYNFKYNDLHPENFYYAVFRYGMSKSTADIENLQYTDGYWDEFGPFNLNRQKYPCHWIEVGGGIKVKLARRVSLGWELTLRPLLSKGKAEGGSPYFIPGRGAGRFGFGFHVYYDLYKKK